MALPATAGESSVPVSLKGERYPDYPLCAGMAERHRLGDSAPAR